MFGILTGPNFPESIIFPVPGPDGLCGQSRVGLLHGWVITIALLVYGMGTFPCWQTGITVGLFLWFIILE